jgi:molybdopterin-guanine dinucleotide biosynthesis protein A
MLTVAIQAGGESRRMGRDKALIPLLGKPMIVHVYERVRSIADEVLVTTNRVSEYEFLGVPLYQDLIKGRGALGGLYTALNAAKNPLVAVVACDMPFANIDLFIAARERLIDQNVDAVLPYTPAGLEPLHAVYRRETCLAAVEWALKSGAWKLISWLPKVKASFIEPQELSIFDPGQIAFWNVNTDEDLQQAQEYLLMKKKKKQNY